MKLDLQLLAEQLSRLEDSPSVSRDGVNDYLLDNILFPCINGADICLSDIDFDAFDAEDIDPLIGFYREMLSREMTLNRLARNIDGIHPAPVSSRAYC